MAKEKVSATGSEKVRRSEYWGKHVAACGASGVSIAQYCREHGLSYSGYQWWKRELKRRDGGAPSEPERPPFAEVQLPSSTVCEALIEIGRAGSWRIGVHPGFDEETLARVLAVVERAGC